MPSEPQLSDFYHASEDQKNGELLFVAVGAGLAIYALYRYLNKMTDKEKLYGAYYQPDRFWAGDKAIKELHKITSMSRKHIKSWLAKQALWQVHVFPREIHHPHYDVTKPNEQHQFDFLYMPQNVFEGNKYKYILTGIDVASRYKIASALRRKNQASLHLCWNQSIRRVVCLNTPRYFNVIMGLSLKIK